MTTQTAYDNGNYRVVVYEGVNIRTVNSHQVILLFDTWRPRPSLDAQTFGEAYLQKHSMSYIALKTARNDWYQGGNITDALNVVRNLTQGRTAIGYGSSMGGYAVINFFQWLNMEGGVVFAPQFSINPEKVPFEKRWNYEAQQINFIQDNIDKISGVKNLTVFFDPYSQDRNHVNLIEKYHHLKKIFLPFSGHEPAEFLRQIGLLSVISLDVINGKPICPIGLKKIIRENRRNSSLYWTELSKTLFLKKRLRDAAKAASIACSCSDGIHYAVQSHAGNMYLQIGEYEKAITIFQKWIYDEQVRDNACYWLKQCFDRIGWKNLSTLIK